ncbi:DUF4097 domain-containing protein [Paenibacillus sp. N1-5-1-14]|uniref:DUF4097 family beta strand repeat-containing protein n=1 Tax=Paenibacillus radicibacter TaxID=2972488 RepID=UPI002158C055|nr:DUF4097 domain-containing protein [Paenibacillus radicibacter]MCR8642650.1 DUF4097 domain-containing protein [Paenibacillus radicibacter]
MNKKIIGFGLILIAIGLIGAIAFRGDLLNGGGNPENSKIAFDKKWDFSANQLKDIKLQGNSEDFDVTFVVSKNGSNSIEMDGDTYQENIDLIQSTGIRDGEFNINLTNKKPNIQFFTIGNFKNNKINVTVTMADLNQLEEIDIETSSGSIKGKNLIARDIDVKSSSGDIRLDGVRGQEIEFKATSGNIIASKVEGVLSAEGSSGNIEIDGVTHDAKIKNSSGNVTLEQKKSANADIKLSSGDAKVIIPKDFAGSFDLKTSSGDTSYPNTSNSSPEVIKVQASSGNITIKQ